MSEEFAPFWDHVADLRRTLLRALLIVALGMVCSLFFYREVFALLTYPLKNSSETALQRLEIKKERIFNSTASHQEFTLPAEIAAPSSTSEGTKEIAPKTYLLPPGGYLEIDRPISQPFLALFSPIDGMIATFKVSFWAGLLLTSPFWAYTMLRFIAPALHPNEKQLLLPFLGLSFFFVTAGICFAYFLTIPIANVYLQAFNSDIGMNLWSLSSYLDYTLVLLVANAMAFELALVLLFLVHLGIVTAESLANKRRHMIVGAFILGALLTPPDVLTQFLLAIPLICLYEASILYAKLRQ